MLSAKSSTLLKLKSEIPPNSTSIITPIDIKIDVIIKLPMQLVGSLW